MMGTELSEDSNAMKIIESCYRALLSLPPVPPETGGLLGGRDGIIDTWYLDRAAPVLDRAVYIPDLPYLNRQLEIWSAQQMDFMGMFHSHLREEPRLSQADQAYIGKIFAVKPAHMAWLFFPVVIPGEKIIPFCAQSKPDGTMEIVSDTLTILPDRRQ